MALKLYRGPRFGTHNYIVSVWTPTDFRHGWAIIGSLVDKNTRKGELVELPVSEKFSRLFSTCLRYKPETWYIQPVGGTTHQAGVSSQSGLCLWRDSRAFFSKCLVVWTWKLFFTLGRLHNTSSRFTRMGSLWLSSCIDYIWWGWSIPNDLELILGYGVQIRKYLSNQSLYSGRHPQ